MEKTERDRLLAQGFNPNDLDLADRFVGLVASLLEEDRDLAEPIRRGIRSLAQKINVLLPELDCRGRTATVSAAELVEAMSPVPAEAIDAFIAIGGTILLTAQDGPLGSVPAMEKVVSELEANRDQKGKAA